MIPDRMSVCALILAAGKSARMGCAKAWLKLDNVYLLQRIVDAASTVCDEVVVVVGTDADPPPTGWVSQKQTRERLVCPAKTTICIGDPQGYPIDSIRAGLHHVPAGSALVLWPVDHPFASSEFLATLVEAVTDQPDHIALPTLGNKHGHPIVFGSQAWLGLNEPIADQGANRLVRSSKIIEVQTDDKRIAATLNTPEQATKVGLRLP